MPNVAKQNNGTVKIEFNEQESIEFNRILRDELLDIIEDDEKEDIDTCDAFIIRMCETLDNNDVDSTLHIDNQPNGTVIVTMTENDATELCKIMHDLHSFAYENGASEDVFVLECYDALMESGVKSQ